MYRKFSASVPLEVVIFHVCIYLNPCRTSVCSLFWKCCSEGPFFHSENAGISLKICHLLMDKWYSRVVSSMQILIQETFWSVKALRQVRIGIPKLSINKSSFSQLIYHGDCYLHYPFQVALLDYGQVKDLPDELRLGYARLVLAIADNDPLKASESYRCSNLPWKLFL